MGCFHQELLGQGIHSEAIQQEHLEQVFSSSTLLNGVLCSLNLQLYLEATSINQSRPTPSHTEVSF